MKIALVSHTPIYTNANGYEVMLTSVAKIFLNRKHDVKVFSLGRENKIITCGAYKEKIIKSSAMSESGLDARRIYEFLVLRWLGYRPSVKKLNGNKTLLSVLEDFGPDLIFIGESTLIDLLEKYKKMHKNVRIITHSDSFSIIENSFGCINQPYRSSTIAVQFEKHAKKVIKKAYFNYHIGQFQKMLMLCDTIMVPSVGDKKEIEGRFRTYSKKIVVLPLVWLNRREAKSRAKTVPLVKKIKRVLFLGAYNYWPNMEAIDIIRQYVAPKLPEIEFIIQGKGCPKNKEENIDYVGEYSLDKLDKLIESCDACIAPMIRHTTIKTKMLEYFLSGKPIVGTAEAFYGYPVKNKINVMIEDNPEKLYMCFKELNRNPGLIAKIQKNMRTIVKYTNSEGIASKLIKISKT